MGAESHLLLLRRRLPGPLLQGGGLPALGLLLSVLHQHGGVGHGPDWWFWPSRDEVVQGPAEASETVSTRQDAWDAAAWHCRPVHLCMGGAQITRHSRAPNLMYSPECSTYGSLGGRGCCREFLRV